jgi:hypothetical protein
MSADHVPDVVMLNPGQQGQVDTQGRGNAGKVGRGQHVMDVLVGVVCACGCR